MNDPRKITKQDVEDSIKSAYTFNASDALFSISNGLVNEEEAERTTICFMTLHNGYTVVGVSTVAFIENFDEEVGNAEAYKDAENKVWPLLAFLYKQDEFELDQDIAAATAYAQAMQMETQ